MKLPEFKNLPLVDFAKTGSRERMEQALDRVRTSLGKEHEIVLGGERLRCSGRFPSINPTHPDEIVGLFQKGSRDLVNQAVKAADEAFQKWSRTPVEKRVEYLLEASRLMQERRLELAAWMVFEVGKSWVEADADVAEAVDFCEYYCRQMLRLASDQPLVRIPEEANEQRYIPLGVGVIIPPWNFPLAILSGMTLAALVAGNTVIIKPSSDSPAIAAQLVSILEEAGLPAGVFNFLTGSGNEIGDPLVLHPRTRFISFTGSKEVGLRINQLAAQPQPEQIWIKRVVAEMGGKDSIIVDSETDLQQAAAGVAASAFGFQGQKCSACSRVIVIDSVYDEFLERLLSVTQESIRQGDVVEFGVNFGPVINRGAQESILRYIEVGSREGQLLAGGKAGSGEGFTVEPTIIAGVAPDAVIAQEEIFGPVLAVIRARDFEQALEIANNTEYGLTGAVYTDNESKIEWAAREFHVGNLYFNRKCTGALVGVHPFGGFNMSGTDSKAGGPDYLLLFTQAKAIARRIR